MFFEHSLFEWKKLFSIYKTKSEIEWNRVKSDGVPIIIIMNNWIMNHILTLYPPKSSTMHVRTASRPTATVAFKIGPLNFGSAEILTKQLVY